MANGKKIVCRQAAPSDSVMIGAITLPSCARHTPFTQSARFSKQNGHVFTSVIFPLSLKRAEYRRSTRRIAHTERIGRTPGGPLLRQGGAGTDVGVFEQVERLQSAACAEVDREHELGTHAPPPPRELVQPNLVRLERVPREVEPLRPPLARVGAVLPPVPGIGCRHGSRLANWRVVSAWMTQVPRTVWRSRLLALERRTTSSG